MDFAADMLTHTLRDAQTHANGVCMCEHCRSIRKSGPKMPRNALVQMQQDAQGALVTDAPAAADAPTRRARAGAEKRRIRLSEANRRGVSRLLDAIQGRRVRNRKAA